MNGPRSLTSLAKVGRNAVFGLLITAAAAGCGGGDGSPRNVAPEAAFSVTTDTGNAPLLVGFDASESTDSDGVIAGYEWVFGDGTTGAGSNVAHTYEKAGAYTAQLTVTDEDGLTDTRSREIVVTASPPEAVFTVSTDSGTAPLTVTFNATGSSDIDGDITGYAWSFGDGTTGVGSSISHIYENAGAYTAELTVTDTDDLTDTQTREIIVTAPLDTGSYTLSGTVSSPGHIFSDSDVNDSNSTPVSNDHFITAQTVLTPCSISGYVNVSGAGSFGHSWAGGDRNDYFRVSLTEDMGITLYMAEHPNTAELNLYLYHLVGNQLVLQEATFTDDYGVASLVAPEDGIYYVRVEAAAFLRVQTATTYTLTIGQTGLETARHSLRLSDDFVPGEVLVRFEDDATDTLSVFTGDSTDASAMGLFSKAGAAGRDRLLRRSEGIDQAVFFNRLGIQSAFSESMAPGNSDSGTTAKMETLWMIRALRGWSGIQYAEPNYIRKAFAVPNDAYYTYQWHYPMIRLPDAWDVTTGGSDVVVAVVDTGVLLDHPDLEGQLTAGYDFISDVDISLDGDGVDANPDDPGDQEGVEGSSFHGTHVAGTIAAASDNGEGVAGVSWSTRIMPLRALGKGGGTSGDILEAVKYAAGLETDAGVQLAEPVDVINLSLGGETYSRIEEAVFAEAREQGVIIVSAAGNNGTADKMYPAAYDGVVSVSAVDINESLASYSNFGDSIDVAAPGGSSDDVNGDGYIDGVLSTIGDDSSGDIEMGYAFSMGTSMAVPHVSGVVALMKALYPGLTPDEFDSLLAAGYLTQDIGETGWDNEFGYGLIDAYKAVQIAREGGNSGAIPAILVASPASLNFGTSLTSAVLKVKNGGGGGAGALTLTDYYSNAGWLSVRATGDVDAYGLGTYSVDVSREGLEPGTTYTGRITFVSDAGNVSVFAVMQVASETGATEGGYHYILLVDPDTYESLSQVDGPGENGRYTFNFSGLSKGDTYVIFAGTDPNNDGFICDEGEACGAYLSLDKPVKITVVEDMEGLEFTTEINISLPETSTSQFAAAGLPLQRNILKEVKR